MTEGKSKFCQGDGCSTYLSTFQRSMIPYVRKFTSSNQKSNKTLLKDQYIRQEFQPVLIPCNRSSRTNCILLLVILLERKVKNCKASFFESNLEMQSNLCKKTESQCLHEQSFYFLFQCTKEEKERYLTGGKMKEFYDMLEAITSPLQIDQRLIEKKTVLLSPS